MLDILGFVSAIVVAGLVIWLAPLALIFALNTLFGLTIATTFKTWAAALFIIAVFDNSSFRRKDSE